MTAQGEKPQSHTASSCKHKTLAHQQAKERDCKSYNTIFISDIVSMLAISRLIPTDTGPSAKKRKSQSSTKFFNTQCSAEQATKSSTIGTIFF